MRDRFGKRPSAIRSALHSVTNTPKVPIEAVKTQQNNRSQLDAALRGSGAPNYIFSHKDDASEKTAHQVSEGMIRAPAGDLSRQGLRNAMSAAPSPKQSHSDASLALGQFDGESIENALRSPARQLPVSLRTDFERSFDQDFSQINIHTGHEASAAASDIGARAFATGRHVVFNSGQYQPDTVRGQQLLAHELTHIAQQKHMPLGRNSQGARFIQRNDHDTPAPNTSSYRWPGSRPLFPDLQLRLDPRISMEIEVMSRMRQILAPDFVSRSLGELDLSTVVTPPQPWLPTGGESGGESQLLVPRGSGPSTPRAGSAGDVLRAVLKIPAVSTALDRVRDQAVGGVRRDWRRLSTGEQVLVITQTALIGGSALTAIFANDSSRSAVLGLIQDRDLPVPGVEGLTLRFNATRPNRSVGFTLNVGQFLPPSLGF